MDIEKTINLIVDDLQKNAMPFKSWVYEPKLTHQIIRKHLTKQMKVVKSESISGVMRSGNTDSINKEFIKARKDFSKACNNYLNSKEHKAMIEAFKKVGAIV